MISYRISFVLIAFFGFLCVVCFFPSNCNACVVFFFYFLSSYGFTLHSFFSQDIWRAYQIRMRSSGLFAVLLIQWLLPGITCLSLLEQMVNDKLISCNVARDELTCAVIDETVKNYYRPDLDLTGPIPNIFCQLTTLVGISFNNNLLTGQIPKCFNMLVNLSYVYISSNQLTGPFPELTSLISMKEFYLSGNLLTGRLPDSIASAWPLMRKFGIHSNKFIGQLPTSYGTWTNLEVAQFNNNAFVGSIPMSYGR